MKKWIYLLGILLCIGMASAYTGNYTIEAELHDADNNIITGTYLVNISMYNTSDNQIFFRQYNITTDNKGRFYEYLNISYDFHDYGYIQFHVEGYSPTNKSLVGEVPRATNSQYIQGRNWSDIQTEITSTLDNGSVVRNNTDGEYRIKADDLYVDSTYIIAGDTIQSTIDGITDESATNPYVIIIPPGTYTEAITLADYISLKGSGKHTTIINNPAFNPINGFISDMSIYQTGGSGPCVGGTYNTDKVMYIDNVHMDCDIDIIHETASTNITYYLNNIDGFFYWDGFRIDVVSEVTESSNVYIYVTNSRFTFKNISDYPVETASLVSMDSNTAVGNINDMIYMDTVYVSGNLTNGAILDVFEIAHKSKFIGKNIYVNVTTTNGGHGLHCFDDTYCEMYNSQIYLTGGNDLYQENSATIKVNNVIADTRSGTITYLDSWQGNTTVNGDLTIIQGTLGNETHRYTWAQLNATTDLSNYVKNNTDGKYNIIANNLQVGESGGTRVQLYNTGASIHANYATADAYTQFYQFTGSDTYSVGIDYSDDGKFKISNGGIGTNDRLIIDSQGRFNVTGDFYAVGTIGNDTHRYTWADLNTSYTDDDSTYLTNGTDINVTKIFLDGNLTATGIGNFSGLLTLYQTADGPSYGSGVPTTGIRTYGFDDKNGIYLNLAVDGNGLGVIGGNANTIYISPGNSIITSFSSTGMGMASDKILSLGSSSNDNFRIQNDNDQTSGDTLMIGLDDDNAGSRQSRTAIICDVNDASYDFQHPDQANPTLFIHSANQATNEYLGLTHDGTNAVIDSGTDTLFINDSLIIDRDTGDGTFLLDVTNGGTSGDFAKFTNKWGNDVFTLNQGTGGGAVFFMSNSGGTQVYTLDTVNSRAVFEDNVENVFGTGLDFYEGYNTSSNSYQLGTGAIVGTNVALEVEANKDVKMYNNLNVTKNISSTGAYFGSSTSDGLMSFPDNPSNEVRFRYGTYDDPDKYMEMGAYGNKNNIAVKTFNLRLWDMTYGTFVEFDRTTGEADFDDNDITSTGDLTINDTTVNGKIVISDADGNARLDMRELVNYGGYLYYNTSSNTFEGRTVSGATNNKGWVLARDTGFATFPSGAGVGDGTAADVSLKVQAATSGDSHLWLAETTSGYGGAMWYDGGIDDFFIGTVYAGSEVAAMKIDRNDDNVLFYDDVTITDNLYVSGNVNVTGCICYDAGPSQTCLGTCV